MGRKSMKIPQTTGYQLYNIKLNNSAYQQTGFKDVKIEDSVSFKANPVETLNKFVKMISPELHELIADKRSIEDVLTVLIMEHGSITNPKEYAKHAGKILTQASDSEFNKIIDHIENHKDFVDFRHILADLAETIKNPERQNYIKGLADRAINQEKNQSNPFKGSKNPILFNIGKFLGNIVDKQTEADVRVRTSFEAAALKTEWKPPKD